MPAIAKRRRSARTNKRVGLHKRLVQIRADIARLKRDRASVRREEFEAMSESIKELHKNTSDLATQLMRIAQIQQAVDVIKRALVKAKLVD